MSFNPATFGPTLSPRLALGAISALLLVELAAIGFVHFHLDAFVCHQNWPPTLCLAIGDIAIASFGVFGALTLYLMLYPDVTRPNQVDTIRLPVHPLAINALGAFLAIAPVFFLRDGAGVPAAVLTFVLWATAAPMILAGALLTLAPLAHWRAALSTHGWGLLICALCGGALPFLALETRSLWAIDWIVEGTFFLVVESMKTLGYEILYDAPSKAIGAGEFFVIVEDACSGVEGMTLVMLFVTLYLVLFRRDLQFPHVLLLYPIGLLASAAFNVLRVVVLISIGLEGNPELAVGGFHSYAGWLTFTLVALGVIALADRVPQFKHATHAIGSSTTLSGSTSPPLWRDPVAARILPFAVFMLSALVVSTFSTMPGMYYPVRMIAVAAILALFWPFYRALSWRVDPVAIAAGAFIGIYWVLIPVETAETPPYGALAGGALLLWYLFRGLGTIVFVPILEELFFRDYLESRLCLKPGLIWVVGAVLISASLFAALHDRWAEAFVAGLIFSAVARRRGNITDAILAHAIANAIVFAVAAGSGNLALI